MRIDKLLIFDIFGDFAHFRRGYTTTSALTYPFPPKSTLIGIIAGIMGLPNEKGNKDDNYFKLLGKNEILVSIRVLDPIKKVIIKENFIDTKHGFTHWEIQKKGQPPRTQIPLEFIKDPHYRIYVWINNNNLFEKLKKFLELRQTFYTPYLGITECIANIKFVGSFEKKKINLINPGEDKVCEIDSIIPKSVNKNIVLEKDISYGVITMPLFINEERKVTEFEKFIFNWDGNPIERKKPLRIKGISEEYKGQALSINRENVVLF